MTQQERAKIVSLISAAIKENGPQELKFLPNCLSGGGVPKAAYSPIKKTLENQFPEFFVFGTSGHEAVDFRGSPLTKFYRLLTARIPYQLPVTQISMLTVAELAREAGLDDGLYASDEAVRKLLRVYPAYQIPEGPDGAESCSTDVDFIQAVAFINWKQVFTKLSQIAAPGPQTMEQVRDTLSFRFAKTLLGGEGLLLDGLDGEDPRAALRTGFQTAKAEDIYCVLQRNTKDVRRQPWMLAGVVYPNEQDAEGLGAWLARTFFSHTGLGYQSVRTRLEALESQRAELLDEMPGLLEAVRSGVCPSPLSGKLARYESGWTELNKRLEEIPSLAASAGKPLAELRQLLNEENRAANLLREAADLFARIYEGVSARLAVLWSREPAEDLALARRLPESANPEAGIQAFQDVLRSYRRLEEVLRHTDRNEVRESIAAVAEHFCLDTLDIPVYLLGKYSNKYGFLDELDQIEALLDDYRQAAVRKEVPATRAVDADTLEKAVFSRDPGLLRQWIDLYRALLPEDPALRELLLSAGEGMTPSRTAQRLLAYCGNRDRLAERYLLLGLLTDRNACAARLLALYRENGDQDRFLALWNSRYRESSFCLEDACCWLSALCAGDSPCWDEIEEFVGSYPDVKRSREYKDAVAARLEREEGYPAAYRRWLILQEPDLNALEAAVTANDPDAVYLLLADPGRMQALGYDAGETAQLQRLLAEGLPGGADAYHKAARLYRAQKNKNAAAERLLWLAPQTAQVLRLLFDIYQEARDHASLCWLTQKFPVPLDTLDRSASYAEALANTGQTQALSALLTQHPELWHRSGLMAGLEGAPWEALCRRETADPLREPGDFALALIADDTAAMEALLADEEKMAALGYSQELRQTMLYKLSQGGAPAGTDPVAVVKRFGYYQGNFRRELEGYLYSRLDTRTDWAIQHLYKLAFSEGRYVDAAKYFEARPRLASTPANVCNYLWCLLRLGETERLFRQAQQNTEALRTDSELVQAVIDLASRENRAELSENIRRMIDLLPQNGFEKAVLTSNYTEVQQYVSDPDRLTAMGYSAESIARFKDRLSGAFPAGTEGYPLAARMRMFFGNERAIPFLQEALSDPRAARLLMDSYFTTQQWDRVCVLYRQQLPNDVWNATYEQRYYEALARAGGAENLRLYLEYLQSDKVPNKTAPAYQWRYLRGLVGAGQEEEALAQMARLLENEAECDFNAAPNVFDMVWQTGSETLRRETVLFAARLWQKNRDALTLEKQKTLLSLHENLLAEEAPQDWIGLLRENGLDAAATFLMCYFGFGVGTDADSIRAAEEKLLDMLEDTRDRGTLTAVTKFTLDNGADAEKSGALLSFWLEEALAADPETGLLGLETFTDGEFSAFRRLWQSAGAGQTHQETVRAACFRDPASRRSGSFFRRILSVLDKPEDIEKLTEMFAQWLGECSEKDPAAVNVAAYFLANVPLDREGMAALLEGAGDRGLLYDPDVKKAVLAKCADKWPELELRYLQALYFRSEPEAQQEVLEQARTLFGSGGLPVLPDKDSLRFAYSIVQADPSPENLLLLEGLYRRAEKPDQAQILLKIAEANRENGDTEGLRQWLFRVLEEKNGEWLEYYAKWWAPLVRLREEDDQTKRILSYLTGDEDSMRYRDSVLRLLLSSLLNPGYIGCFLRLEKELPAEVSAKLTYLRALRDPAVCAEAIRECIAMGQQLYAVKLLVEQIKPVPANAVFIGQTAGEVYTPQALVRWPELNEFVPSVFRLIIRLNQADPAGAWKNVGRAVDIAILTRNEGLFFDIFNEEYQNMYYTYAPKCAVLMANLVLRGDHAAANRYLQEYKSRKNNDPYAYMALLEGVIEDCVRTGTLSEENDILVRSIPLNGNMRSLELYGSLVHYALAHQRIRACAKAFFALRAHAPQDKALLACCIQMYSVLADELPVKTLYEVTKSYLEIVQDSLVFRTGKLLAVVASCCEELEDWQLLEDCRCRIQDGEDLSEIKSLERDCARFLEGAVGLKERIRFLIRAATGWWRVDGETVEYAHSAGALFEKLLELHPSAFYSACICGALRVRENPRLCDDIIALMGDYDWGREQLTAALQYPNDLCEALIAMTDAPMDLPGLYNRYLEQTLAEPDGERFRKRMNLLLSVQRNFTVTQFEENLYGLKEMSEACPGDRQYELFRLMLKKSTLASNTLLMPNQYVDAGEYGMAVISAEKQLERQGLTRFFETLNTVYLELGKFMTERSSARKYKLQQLMNMATLLCQSKSYRDLHLLMEACPAKWKLCLRTVQEFIQGDPRNVLYLLKNADFREHDGCYTFVYILAQNYLEGRDWKEALEREKERKKRDKSWGLYNLRSVERPTPRWEVNVFLLRANMRNPAALEPYREFVDANIAQMKKDDGGKNRRTASDGTAEPETEEMTLPGASVDQGEELWKLPFVAECLARYQSEETPEEDDYGSREDQKKALRQALDTSRSHAETVELCGKLLSLMRQEPVTNITRETCISLGLALFCEKQEHRGLAARVTEEARAVLYSMAPCFKGVPSAQRYGSTLKIYVRECLESYQDLAQFTADCMDDGLMALCNIIGKGDKEAAKYLKNHIRFAQAIGKKMREPMTNTDRLAWLQSCIAQCRAATGHPVEVGAKEALVSMLNQEIRVFRNKAQVYLSVYNTETVAENGSLFGKVENLGGESISKLVVALSVNGIFKAQYTMPALSGGEMVPFCLPCGEDAGPGTLAYKLSMKYTTQDGTEETATPVEGALTLVEPGAEKRRFQRYDASNPADSDNYIERASISTTLEANFLVDGGFRRFPNFAIYGMKRSGKSSVLRRIGRLFDEHYPDSVRHVIVSCEGITGDFYARAHAVFVKYVLDELSFKFELQDTQGWQEFCEKWEDLTELTPDFRWLDSFYFALTRQWLPDAGLVILIDEIERLYFALDESDGFLSGDPDCPPPAGVDSGNAQSVLWDVINKMTQREGSMVRFVLCGSDFFTSKIIAEGDNLTQFFQKGVKLNVDRMEYEEIRAALCANSSITLHEDTVNYLWDIAAGLPWHSKIFCNSVIENQLIRREGGTRSVIYPSDIQDAIDLILSTTKDIASPANFGLLSLNGEEEQLVRAAAEALDSRLAKISFDELMERVCPADKDAAGTELYAKALRSLVNERKLLRLDKGRNYQFGCELYRLYLRHEVPSRFL